MRGRGKCARHKKTRIESGFLNKQLKLVVPNQYSIGMALTWAAVKTGPSLQT